MKEQGFKNGLAISRFNLADVYFRAENFEESEKLFLQSKEFWLKQDNKARIFGMNVFATSIV